MYSLYCIVRGRGHAVYSQGVSPCFIPLKDAFILRIVALDVLDTGRLRERELTRPLIKFVRYLRQWLAWRQEAQRWMRLRALALDPREAHRLESYKPVPPWSPPQLVRPRPQQPPLDAWADSIRLPDTDPPSPP
jgi:hypothetical protein